MSKAIKWLLFVVLLLVIPGGWLVLLGIAFVWAVRYGDELAAYSRQSYAEFKRNLEGKGNCPKCGGSFFTHNDDGSCAKERKEAANG